MQRSRCFMMSSIAALLICSSASAGIILETSGTSINSLSIGTGNGQQAGAIGFSTDYRLEDVTFTVPLRKSSSIPPQADVRAYLTTSIGPGTTTDDLVADNIVPITGGQMGEFLVLSQPELDPGTYYLMLVVIGQGSVGWDTVTRASHVITTAPGVEFLSSLAYAQASGSFPPAFQPLGDTRDGTIFPSVWTVRIEGTVIPEPATFVLLTMAGLVVPLRYRRR